MSKVSGNKQFKLRWNEKEIFKFYDKVYHLLSDSKYNYHCLLYFISCHGDSNGNKVPLITIFDINLALKIMLEVIKEQNGLQSQIF